MKTTIKITLFQAGLFLALLLPGISYGQVSNQVRDLGPFDKIQASGAVSVRLKQDEAYTVRVEATEGFQDKVTTKVDNGKLTIKGAGDSKSGKLVVHVSAPNLKAISVEGASKIQGENSFKAEELYISCSGASDIKMEIQVQKLITSVDGAASINLSGSATEHTGSVSGAGDLNAFELVSRTANIKVSGAGDADINVTETLTADVSGAGDLKLKDEPINKIINKSGAASASQSVSPGVSVRTDAQGDTTKVRVGSVIVEVVEDDTVRVTIGDRHINIDEDGNVDIFRAKKEKFNGHWGGFDIGVNGYVNSDFNHSLPAEYDFLDLRMERSLNIQVNAYEQNFNLVKNHFGLITGIGLEWVNYFFDDNTILNPDTAMIWYTPAQQDYTKSKLMVNYLSVPLLMEYQTNPGNKSNSFHFTAGMQLGWRIGSHSKNVFDDGDKEKEKSKDDFHMNPFKYQAMARIGWGVINLWGTYSLNTLFKDNEGPEVYPYSIGLTLLSW